MLATRLFASDNCASVHPEIISAISEANRGHVISYGDDDFTRRAIDSLRREFGEDSSAYFVYNGTGANVLGLSGITRPFSAIICAEYAHINEDECGAPEKYTGCKLYTVHTPDGKLRPADIERFLPSIGYEHHAQPAVVSITQATEVGTVYQPREIKALADIAHDHGMSLHMDGARIANAAVGLGVSLRAITRDAGVDVLSFGGTKNGLMYGEAVLFFARVSALASDFRFIRKQGMQLASKMRYIGAQFDRYLSDELWKKNAMHANAMAKRLSDAVTAIRGCSLAFPTEANGVFARIPRRAFDALRATWGFYEWPEDEDTADRSDAAASSGRSDSSVARDSKDGADDAILARWMCSFDTTVEDVDAFVADLRNVVLMA